MPWKRREALTRGREENTKKRGRQSRAGQGRYPRRSGGLGNGGGNVVKISLIKMYVWEVQNEKTR